MKILLFYSLQLFSDAVWGRGFLFVHLNYTTSTIAYEFPKWGLLPPGDPRTDCQGVRDRSGEYQGPLDFSSKKSRIIKFSLRI